MVTIADVAQRAGVSVATVSRTLHGSAKVDPRTRARVLAAADELSYVASPTAMSLASGRTHVIAVVAPMMSRWFFASIVTAIEQNLRETGYHVMLFSLEAGPGAPGRFRPEFFAKRVDGILWLNVAVTPAEEAQLAKLDLPMVCVGTQIGDSPTVLIDDHRAARTAVTHLLSLGHREIAYVGTPVGSIAHMTTPAARVAAFRETLVHASVPVREGWVLAADWTADGAMEAVEPLLRSDRRPTAVLAASDEMAIGALGAAARTGLRVPEDLSVMGIDDHSFAGALGLSTVHQDVPAQGRAAAQLLLAAVRNRDTRTPATRIELATHLIPRQTTAPPQAAG